MRPRPYRAEGIAFVSFFQTARHQHAGQGDGVQGPWAPWLSWSVADRRTSEGRPARYQGQGQAPRPPKGDLGREENCYVPLQECRLEADRRRHGVGVGTLCSVALHGSKTREKVLNPEVGGSRLSRWPVA
jgi:hypothetical protein